MCTAFALALSRSLIHLMARSRHYRCTLNAIRRIEWCVGCMAWWRSPDHDAAGLCVFLLFSYAFFALAIVCDRYLVVSLETLCVRWNIREDVAGASFMVSAAHAVAHTPPRVHSQL